VWCSSLLKEGVAINRLSSSVAWVAKVWFIKNGYKYKVVPENESEEIAFCNSSA
jgi:hypothetical protein